jgi:hypothetical protein
MRDRSNNYKLMRTRLQFLRTRYDHGAVSPAVYNVIRSLETDIGGVSIKGGGKEKREKKKILT